MANAAFISKRNLFKALPFLAMGGIVSHTQADPIHVLIQDWRDAVDEYNQGGVDDAENERLFNRYFELENVICSTKPTTREGIAAQLDFISECFGADIETIPTHVELLKNATAAIRELAA